MIKTGLVGGAESTAAQLMRLLLHHPDVDLRWVIDAAHAGQGVAQVHPALVGETDLTFCDEPGEQQSQGMDVLEKAQSEIVPQEKKRGNQRIW